MRPALIACLCLLAMPAVAAETRCGWLDNPTPANWWLTDAQGEWGISVMGGPAAQGMDTLPDMTTAGWVATNGNYGYGCACLSVETDATQGRIIRILSARPIALAKCHSDAALPPR